MNTQQKVIKTKVGLLELGKRLGNVAQGQLLTNVGELAPKRPEAPMLTKQIQ